MVNAAYLHVAMISVKHVFLYKGWGRAAASEKRSSPGIGGAGVVPCGSRRLGCDEPVGCAQEAARVAPSTATVMERVRTHVGTVFCGCQGLCQWQEEKGMCRAVEWRVATLLR